jgi:dihydrofolate reductase
MEGGTSFHFVNEGIESALKQAFAAANGKDVRVGGGASTVRQYLEASLIDELHIVQVPILLGSG